MKLVNYSILALLLFSSLSFAQPIDINFQNTHNQPYFLSPETTIDADQYNTLIIKIESKQKCTARLFWVHTYDLQFNQPKSIWFSVKTGRHDYYFNLPAQNPNWIGWIKGFLVYPEAPKDSLTINEAQITEGSITTNIRSGWQEFWGPKGRVVIGSTINLIPSSSINGISINVYIYWLAGIGFILLFAWNLANRSLYDKNKKNKKIDYNQIIGIAYDRSIRLTLAIILICSVLMALNTNYNYLNLFKENFAKYFGKTIEQKRAAAYGQEYYNFLVFTKERLPTEPVCFGVLSSRYATDLQARIFLFPHIFEDLKKSRTNYLLMFYPDANRLGQFKDYKVYASMNKNAYILKRTK